MNPATIQNDVPAITKEDMTTMVEFCKYPSLSRQEPEVVYKTLMEFVKEMTIHSSRFGKADPQKASAIISTVKLVLQKVRDDIRKFMPLLLKLFACESFHSDTRYEFTLDKDDFSYYFALDFAVQRILKLVQQWEASDGRAHSAIMVLTLWNQCPEFGPIYLGRMAKLCPYTIPYIPADGKVIKLADERLLSTYIRFQAALITTPNKLGLFDLPFAWLWLQNALKQLKNANYRNQSFCYVFREFLEMLKTALLIDNYPQYMYMLNLMQSNLLPPLQGIDPGMHGLKDYIKNFLSQNAF